MNIECGALLALAACAIILAEEVFLVSFLRRSMGLATGSVGITFEYRC